MEFIFLNAAGQTLFSRDDIESGHWVQEQMNVTADFPFDPAKKIERGMRIAFRDPATDGIEVFEIRVVVNQEPDHYQQITAEHIALSELSDEHINTTEITDKTAAQALTTALTGTLWSLGNNTASGTQSADISRGSVWDAVNTIQNNWNVYITPRVVISSAGAITGRYLDISPAQGTWRGLRLSVRKNMTDPAVTINDEDVLTALYGYGGNVDVPQASGDDKTETLTFADVVWSATSDHPAKPYGQTYLEWPEKTALYGRNGRPRYGYYQNGNIKDASILLQKTWEALKKTADPKISISGSVTDLYRLGYKDEPIRLHDLAIVDIEETGEQFQKEIICCDVDLVDPANTRPKIGDYIPNIIYINRDTNEKARGGGGGGGRGNTDVEDDLIRTFTDWVKTDEMIGMVVGTRQGNNYVKAGQIILAINKSGESGSYESSAYINADHINIGASTTVYTLAGDLYHDSTGKLVVKNGVGLYAEHTVSGSVAKFGVFDDNTLTGGICAGKINGQSGTVVKLNGDVIDISSLVLEINASQVTISADVIDVNGIVTELVSYDLTVATLETTNSATFGGEVSCMEGLSMNGSDITDATNLDAEYATFSDVDTTSLSVNGSSATWQSKSVTTSISHGSTGSKSWMMGDETTHSYDLCTWVLANNSTIYYLGR